MREDTRNALEEERSKRGIVIKDYGNGSKLVDMSHAGNFVEGAEWYLGHIWHEKEETPEVDKDIIILKEPPIAGSFRNDGIRATGEVYWGLYDGYCHKDVKPSRWCYVEDIMIDKQKK